MKQEINDTNHLVETVNAIIPDYVFIWKYDGITTLARAIAANDIDDINDIVEIRAFNETNEVRVWRSGDKLFYRDSAGHNDDVKTVQTQMNIVGAISEKLSELNKDKFKITDAEKKEKKLQLTTANYFNYNKVTGQAGYVDCRFVKIEKV